VSELMSDMVNDPATTEDRATLLAVARSVPDPELPVLTLGDVLLVSIQVDLEDQLTIRLQEDLAEQIVATGAHGVIIDITALDGAGVSRRMKSFEFWP